MVIESAADRMQRILVIALGVGSLAFTLIGATEIIAEHSRLEAWYSIPLYVIFLGIPPVLAALAYTLSARAQRLVLFGYITLSAVAFALWLPATVPGAGPTDAIPWIQNIYAIACAGAGLVLPYTLSITYTVVLSALVGVARFGSYGGLGGPSAAVQDALYGLLFCATLVTLLQLSRRAASLQDSATAEAEAESTRTSTAEALERQRHRYHDFIRDEVRGVFTQAIRGGSIISSATRDDAARVLEQLKELQGQAAGATSLSISELQALLERAAEGQVTIRISPEDAATNVLVPFEVADALASAFGEAVRNSVRHAGTIVGRHPVLRRAWITASADRVEVVMSDDGVGFNPARVPIDRMGVRVGIFGALERVPGARATISSSRGRGASVALTWERGAS